MPLGWTFMIDSNCYNYNKHRALKVALAYSTYSGHACVTCITSIPGSEWNVESCTSCYIWSMFIEDLIYLLCFIWKLWITVWAISEYFMNYCSANFYRESANINDRISDVCIISLILTWCTLAVFCSLRHYVYYTTKCTCD